MTSRFKLGAYWPPRRESIEECCDRLAPFMLELAACDPVFASWFEGGYSLEESLANPAATGDRQYLMDSLNRGRNRRDIGDTVIEELGFRVGWWNGASNDRAVSLGIHCGSYCVGPNPDTYFWNSVLLRLPRDLGALGQPENMAQVLAVVAKVWEPAWAGVYSQDAMDKRKFDIREPFVDWMTYVPADIGEVPAPSLVYSAPGRGSLVVVQPEPPGDTPGELQRIQRIKELLRKAQRP